MTSLIAPSASFPLSERFCTLLNLSLSLCKLPSNAKHIVLNFRNDRYDETRQGARPLEIHLSREADTAPWQISVLASFAYPHSTSYELELELYFNLKRQWFYHPELGVCALLRPEVIALFRSWEHALSEQLINQELNQLRVTTTRLFSAS